MGEKLRDMLTAHAVASLVERRGKCSQTAFSRRHSHDASTDAALARKPDIEEPVP